MDSYALYGSGQRPGQPAPAPARPAPSRGMDGTTRAVIVGGVVALAVYFGWPYLRGEMAEIGRQVGRMNRSGVEPAGASGLRQDGQRPGGRYRECRYDGRHVTCGDWKEGPPPSDGRLVVRPGERPDLEPPRDHMGRR